MTDVSFAAVRPVRAAGIVYAVALAAACRGGSARKPAAARVAAPDTVPPPDTVNLYAAAGANALSSVAARARPLVYVPNSHDGSVTVIDPRRYQVAGRKRTDHPVAAGVDDRHAAVVGIGDVDERPGPRRDA